MSKKNGISQKCLIPDCPNPVYVRPCEPNKKYCSRECLGLANGERGKALPRTKIELTCQQCKKQFLVSPSCSDQKCCSWACTNLLRTGVVKEKVRLEIQCLQCGKSVPVAPCNKDQKYCSRGCTSAGRKAETLKKGPKPPKPKSVKLKKSPTPRKGREAICLQCPNPIYIEPNQEGRKHFCSRECADLGKIAVSRTKIGKIVGCLQCANFIYVTPCHEGKKKFCSQPCAYAYNSISLPGPSRKEQMGLAPYRKWRKAVLLRDNHCCVKCKATEKLEVDHIIPWNASVELRYEPSNGQATTATLKQTVMEVKLKSIRKLLKYGNSC